MPVVRPYNLPEVEARPIPNVAPNVAAAGDIGSFGGNQARDLQVAGQNLGQTGDILFTMYEREAKEANDTRVQDLSNQYVENQQKILFTDPNAFYRQRGDAAINAAEPTTKALQQLKTDYLAQTKNAYQRDLLGKRLDLQLAEATGGMSRHVATQATVWQDTVAKGTIANASNQAVFNANDPAKVQLHAQGAWQTEYDRLIKVTGDTPEGKIAAQAGADGVRSNILRSVIETQAVTDPAMAQRTLEANRDKLDASDVPTLSRKIKIESDQRRAQDIVNIVSATGGVSPNYNNRVGGAESGGSYQIENKIGALGKYQMIPSTYTSLAQDTEWGKGKSQAEIRALLLDPTEGPKRQEELQGGYNNRSIEALRKAGVQVNDLSLYATHFLGHGAGPELLKLPDDTPLQAGLLKAHGNDAAFVQKVNDANPFLAKVQTVGDFKALMAQKIGAPGTMATTGSPQKPNLDAMLASGLAMAGNDPDLRDRVTQSIKTDYATKLALYTAQIGALEKQAFAHIDAGGTIENLPSNVKGALDADGLTKVQAYEEKRLEKRRKDNSELAGKSLTDLERLGQLQPEDVEKARNFLPANEYRAWQKRAIGVDRIDDPGSYERLQRGLGTRDMRDDIFSEFNSGNLSRESMDRLLDKNAGFVKEGSAPTPYKIGHDRITRSLDPGLMGGGISREIYGRAVKEFDQYVAGNPQREGETPEQFRKRVDDFSEDTVKRHQLLNTQEMSISKPVPVHVPFNRNDMTGDKSAATKKIAGANGELAKRFADGLITEDQYNRDALTLLDWLNFVQSQPDAKPAPARR